MPHTRGRPILHRVATCVVEGLALVCIRLAPADRAYDWLVRLAAVTSALGAKPFALLSGRAVSPRIRSLVLRDMLSLATRKGGIAIRVDLRGEELLRRAYADHGRVVLCTAHFGLTVAIFSVLEARGMPYAAVGRDVSDKRDRLHWGCARPATLIESDRLCLVRARLALESGAVVLLMPEQPHPPREETKLGITGYDVDPNSFSFAALLGVPVLFYGADLGRDGTIVLDLVEPVHSRPHDEADAMALAEEYRRFLEARTRKPCRIATVPRDFLRSQLQHAA